MFLAALSAYSFETAIISSATEYILFAVFYIGANNKSDINGILNTILKASGHKS